MTDRMVAVIDAGGRPIEQVFIPEDEPNDLWLQHYATRAPDRREVEVDRWAAPGEHWIDGQWQVADHDAVVAAIDAAHLADHGLEALARAHATKATEARLILAGVAVNGWVAAEARLTGEDMTTLAERIVAKDQAALEIEMERRRAKREVRDAGEATPA